RVVPVTSGTRTLKDATNEALRDWVTNVTTTHYIIGSVVGPDPFPRIVRDFQSIIGREARAQALERWGKLPSTVVACVGGGSNAMGIFAAFLDDREVALVGVEAAGEGLESGHHAASLGRGRPGVFHGSLSYLLQNADGQVQPAHSVSAGLDYPGVGPEHAYLKDSGRVLYDAVTDQQALEAFASLSRLEGILPALESAHAVAWVLAHRAEWHAGNIVYNQEQRGESIAWTLYKDGVRSLAFKPGVEEAEIVSFLGVLQRARNLQADAADDLLTLLWAQDFQFVSYTFRELASENAAPIEAGETIRSAPPTDVRHAVEAEAPPKREGLVSIDDFDTTLYFLEDNEVAYLKKDVEREYSQDLRRNVLSMLFDLLELQTYGTVRAELISIVENFIPYLLGAADFRSVAVILRESRAILQRARELIPEHRQAL